MVPREPRARAALWAGPRPGGPAALTQGPAGPRTLKGLGPRPQTAGKGGAGFWRCPPSQQSRVEPTKASFRDSTDGTLSVSHVRGFRSRSALGTGRNAFSVVRSSHLNSQFNFLP